MSRIKPFPNEKKKRVKPHIGRILMYLLLYGVILFFYLFLYGYMQLVLLVLWSVLPVISIVSVCVLAKYCNVRLTVSEKNIIRGEKFWAGILLYNPTVLMSFHVRCKVNLENTFYRTQAELTADLPMVLKGESKVEIPFVADRNGVVEVRLTEMEILDFCGLISIAVPLDMIQNIYVFPEKAELGEEEKAGFYAGIAENEEDISKGNDFADTSNIREYVPGDRMKDIHWKLSAKKEVLLVKERIRMAESQLVVWLELSGSRAQMDDILKLCYNLIRTCNQEGILVKLMWHGGKYVIGNQADRKEAFRLVYASGTDGGQETAEMVLQEEKRPVRKYLRVGLYDKGAKAVVVEHDV